MDIFKAKLTWGLVISALVLQFMGASSCSLICPVDIFDLPVPRLLSWLLPKLLPIPPPLEQHFSIWFNPLYRYGSVLRFFIYPLLHRGSGLLMFNLLGFIPLGLYLETGQDVIGYRGLLIPLWIGIPTIAWTISVLAGTILSRDPNIPCNVGLSPLGCGLAIVQLYAMFMDRSVRSDDEAVQIAFVGLIVVPLYLGTCLYQAVANADFDYEGHAAGVLVGFLFVLNELSNIKLTTPRGGAGQTRAQSDAAADAERKAEVRRRKQNQD